MQFGVIVRSQIPLGDDISLRFAELMEQARLAERLGFESFIKASHYSTHPLQDFAQVPFLARLSAEAPKLRLNAGIVLLSLHKPLDIAEPLGLGLDIVASDYRVAEATLAAVGHRTDHRSQRQYDEADEHRSALVQNGFVIEDGADGTGVRPKTAWEQRTETWHAVSSSSEVDSLIGEPDAFDITVGLIARLLTI